MTLRHFFALSPEIALRVLSRALALTGGKEEPPRMTKVERLLAGLRAGKREAALGGCLVIAAAGTLNFYREPGRMGQARLVCEPGSTRTWDGRFVLTIAADLSGDFSVAPLGALGWANCRKAMKERGKAVQANRLAALASPALWQGAAPRFGPSPGVCRCRDRRHPRRRLFEVQLVPRLSHFLTST